MTEKRFALIIANDEYEDESLRKLEAPQLDADALKRVLSNPDICNFEVQMLLNKKSHEVDQEIEAFFTDRSRDDLLLLYFSGHGLKDKDGKLYFCTPDTNRKRLRTTAISANLVNDMMRKSRSQRQVLLLDCCYSGAFAKGMIAKSGKAVGTSIGTSDYFQGRGRVVLTASDTMQYAFEEDEIKEKDRVHSLFTRAIVDGIETWKADRDRDDRISLDELYYYVDYYVQDKTPNQRPEKWLFDIQGEIIIAEREHPADLEELDEHEEIIKPIDLEQPIQLVRALPIKQITTLLIVIGGLVGFSLISGIVPFSPRFPKINYFTASPDNVTLGGSSTLRWSVSDATNVSMDQGIGSLESTDTTLVSPDETTTYTITATNKAGSVTARVVVTRARVIQIGITTGSTSRLETTVSFVEDILEPDIAAYIDMLGYDITFDFIVKDNQGQVGKALENTQTYRAMGIDLIIGHSWSSQCSASLGYIKENDMLLFSDSSISPMLAIPDDRLFRACPNDLVQAPAIAEMWQTWGAKALLIMHSADAWGDSLYNVFAPELADRGIVELDHLRYVSEVTEFSSYLATAEAIITNAILIYGKEHVGIQFFSSSELMTIQTQAADYPNLIDIIWMTTGSGGRSQAMLDKAAGSLATQTRHFSPMMAPDVDSNEFRNFNKTYYDVTGYKADFYSAALYDACRLLVECILETGSTEASEIAKVLIPMSQDYYGLTGRMSLDENGDRQPQMFDIWGFYEDSDTREYLFMKFGEYYGQTGEVHWDDDALVDLAGIIRPGP